MIYNFFKKNVILAGCIALTVVTWGYAKGDVLQALVGGLFSVVEVNPVKFYFHAWGGGEGRGGEDRGREGWVCEGGVCEGGEWEGDEGEGRGEKGRSRAHW